MIVNGCSHIVFCLCFKKNAISYSDCPGIERAVVILLLCGGQCSVFFREVLWFDLWYVIMAISGHTHYFVLYRIFTVSTIQ